MFCVCGGIGTTRQDKQPKPWTGRFRTNTPRDWTADKPVSGNQLSIFEKTPKFKNV